MADPLFSAAEAWTNGWIPALAYLAGATVIPFRRALNREKIWQGGNVSLMGAAILAAWGRARAGAGAAHGDHRRRAGPVAIVVQGSGEMRIPATGASGFGGGPVCRHPLAAAHALRHHEVTRG